MNKCVLCSESGRGRKYFFKGKPLCDKDYAGYLEFLLDELEEEVTSEDANSACKAYMLKLELKPGSLNEEEKKEKERREQEEEDLDELDSTPSPYGMGM